MVELKWPRQLMLVETTSISATDPRQEWQKEPRR